nr:hypothetical protein [Chloroflexota bacterium]
MEPKEYKEHREQLIRKSYALIREYEDIIQTSSDPKEKARARRVIEEQWNHIWEYLESYIPLCIHLKRRVPDDIRQLPVPTDVAQLIVARYAEHDLASLYVKGLLSSLDLKQFRSLCLDLLEEKGYHIEDDDKKAATILATRESRLTGKEMWAIRFVHSPDRDPDAWVRRREIAFRELKRLSGQLDVVGYLFITSSQFSTDLHEYFRSGLQGKEVQYWDGPIIKALLLDYPYFWQKYVSPYQLTERSPLLSAYYELVDDELLAQQPSVSAKAFYGGNRPGWGEIAADLDARRIVYSGDTVLSYEQLLETLRSGSAERFILLTAEAGGGKTTLLFRIGYDLYQLNKLSEEDTHMVLRLRYGASPHAHPLIELHQQTRKPLYVLMDIHDTEVQIKGLDGMLSELHAQKVPATVIAAARANEWGQARGWQKVRRSGIPSSTTLELGKLSLQEIEAILDLLQKHNQLPPLDSQVRKQLRDDFFIRLADRQLFVALMEITHDKKRFEHILLDEYENLPRIARRAYRYVCVLHAYGILLPRDFLVSVLKLNRPADLWDDVLLPTEGVIVEDTERTGYVRTRHHRIAEALKNRLADNVLKDIQSLKEMAASIIEAARYYIGVERYVVLKLLLGLVQDSMYPPETRKEFVKGLSNTYSDEIANMLYRAKVEGRYIELAEWGRLYYELDELGMDQKCLEDALHIAPVNESARLNYYY